MDSGLVPKKLKQGDNNLFELRASKKLRVLYSKMLVRNQERYVFWDLAGHDKIARRQLSPPPCKDAYEIEIAKDLQVVDIAIESASELVDFSPPLADDLFRMGNDALFRKMTAGEIDEMPWLIHEELAPLLKESLPICLNGPAGSGKTTLGIYRLINEVKSNHDAEVLYVTYTKNLVDYAEKISKNLCSKDELGRITFCSFHQLCWQILACNEKRLYSYNEFKRMIPGRYRQSSHGSNLQLPLTYLWSIIRSCLKGGIRSTMRLPLILKRKELCALLDKAEDLEKLPKKKKPPESDLREIILVGRLYQDYLENKCRWDEIDLARKCVTKATPSYDMIFCDEIQDLTEIQQAILFLLLRKEGGKRSLPVFFVGDEGQMIHPSGFLWSDTKLLIKNFGYSQNIQTVLLRTNYRCSSGIVDFANALIGERKKYWSKISSDISLKPLRDGNVPFFMETGKGATENFLSQIGHNTMIIVVSDDDKVQFFERYRIEKTLGGSVFTLEEAKGLEFEHVILFHFLNMFLDIYESCTAGSITKGQPHVRHIFNMFFVGVTRAISNLFLADCEKNITRARKLRLFEQVRIGSWETFLNQQTPMEGSWGETAVRLLDKERYYQAHFAFNRAGHFSMANFALGRFQENAGELEKAVESYARGNRWSEVVRLAKHFKGKKSDVVRSLIFEDQLVDIPKFLFDTNLQDYCFKKTAVWMKSNGLSDLVNTYYFKGLKELNGDLFGICDKINYELKRIDLSLPEKG